MDSTAQAILRELAGIMANDVVWKTFKVGLPPSFAFGQHIRPEGYCSRGWASGSGRKLCSEKTKDTLFGFMRVTGDLRSELETQ